MKSLDKIIDRKFSIEWILDKIWPFALIAFGGSVTAGLSYLTDWLSRIGPIVYAIAFIAGSAALSIIIMIFAKAQKIKIINDYAREALKNSSANPLLSKFENEIVKIPIFYSPYYISHKEKIFHNCQVAGPGNVLWVGGTMVRSLFKHCQIAIISDKPNTKITNVTVFENCSFTSCQLINITIFMTKENYQNMPKDLIEYIPIVSGTI